MEVLSIKDDEVAVVPRVGVTGIAFRGDSVLACVGDALCEFSLDGRLLHVTRMSPRGNVLHGVVVEGLRVIVFGGRHLTELGEEQEELPDWILAVGLVEQVTIAVLARGYVVVWDRRSGRKTIRLSTSLLSCAIVTADWGVVAGTYAGEVKRWRIEPDKQEATLVETLQFNSTVYSVSRRSEQMAVGCDDRALHAFGKTLFGHGGRIWDVKFFEDCVISAGEDGTLRWWSGAGQQFEETVSVSRSPLRRIAVRRNQKNGEKSGFLKKWR
jgi:hypothetical protein